MSRAAKDPNVPLGVCLHIVPATYFASMSYLHWNHIAKKMLMAWSAGCSWWPPLRQFISANS